MSDNTIQERMTDEEKAKIASLRKVEEDKIRYTKKAKALNAKRLKAAKASKTKREAAAKSDMSPLEFLNNASMTDFVNFTAEIRTALKAIDQDYIVIVKSTSKGRKIVLRVLGSNTEQKFVLNFLRYPLCEQIGNKTCTQYIEKYTQLTASVTAKSHREKSYLIGRIKASSDVYLVHASFANLDNSLMQSYDIQNLIEKHRDNDPRIIERLGKAKSVKSGKVRADLSSLI